jgi:hypothetical protein
MDLLDRKDKPFEKPTAETELADPTSPQSDGALV